MLNVSKVSLFEVDGAKLVSSNTLIKRALTRSLVSVTTDLRSLATDDQSGQIVRLSSIGGFRGEAPYLEQVLEGGRLTVNNMRVDVRSKVVYADLHGQARDENDELLPSPAL